MYLDNNDFVSWMEKLSTKLNEIGKDLKSFTQTKDVLEEDEKIMDNQDLAFLLKVSYRTLQRYRTSGKLPYFSIGHKTYYRVNDVRHFVREHMDLGTYKSFEEKHPKDKTQMMHLCSLMQNDEGYVWSTALQYRSAFSRNNIASRSFCFAELSKRELDYRPVLLLPCGAKPSALVL